MEPFIIDVSSNNEHPINWHQVKHSGCIGVLLKATEGTSYVNPDYAGDLAHCLAVRLPVMAYHFAGFGDPLAEAEFFLKTAGDLHARMLDIETSTNLAWSKQFFDGLPALTTPEERGLYGSRLVVPDQHFALAFVADYGVPSPGVVCDLWQYTDTGIVPGVSGHVDMSKWLGSRVNYDSFFRTKNPL